MEPSHHNHHHLRINTLSSVQSTVPPPPPLPKPHSENIFVVLLAVIGGIVIAKIILLILTLFGKCLGLCCNQEALMLIFHIFRACLNHETPLNTQSPPSIPTTPSSNHQKPPIIIRVPEETLGFILITYNTTPSDDSGSSSSEMFGHEISCSICLGEYENGDKIAVLRNCNHGFHQDCIRQWLPNMSSVLCPLCRHACDNLFNY